MLGGVVLIGHSGFEWALNGFAGRRVGTRQIRGRNSMEIQFGSKHQLRLTSTGTSPTVFGGSMSPVGTVFTLPRLLPGLLHRQAGSPSDPLGLCLVLWPLLETCEILY